MRTSTLQQTTEKKGGFRFPFLLVKKTRPLRRKIVLWNVLILFLTLLLFSVVVYLLVTANLVNDLDQRLRAEGERLQTFTRLSSKMGHPFNAAFFQQLVQEEKGDEFALDAPKIKLLDTSTAHVVSRSANLTGERIPFNKTDFTAALQGQQVFRTYQDISGRRARLLTLPLRDVAGHVILVAQVSLSQAAVERVRNLLIVVPSLSILVGTLIAYIVGFLFTVHELRPLRTLSTTMRSLSMQGLGRHIPQQSAVIEVQQLTDAFNQMSERLEASFALQRNFVENVSHELRTPLTAIQGQMDVLLLNPELGEDVRQDVQQVRAELGRLSRLVSNLLMRARAEVGTLLHPSSHPTHLVELDALLITVIRQARFLKREVALEIRELQQASVPGDADLLKQLVLNILDNALTYTPAGGRVDAALACTAEVPPSIKEKRGETEVKWARLTVCDTGPGIDPADLPHIFERHYRSDRTSAMSSRTALGSGLGLSMAYLIAEAHGGTITVESQPGQGACFTLWLPSCHEVLATSTPP
ncbi:MAG: sensor histidine kinase [Ktedonobacteraceae bacterium]